MSPAPGEPVRYTIEKIEDVLAIPHDKFDDFLIDLATWAQIMRATRALAEAGLARQIDMPGECGPGRFVWIDDGKHDARVKLYIEPKPNK